MQTKRKRRKFQHNNKTSNTHAYIHTQHTQTDTYTTKPIIKLKSVKIAKEKMENILNF